MEAGKHVLCDKAHHPERGGGQAAAGGARSYQDEVGNCAGNLQNAVVGSCGESRRVMAF